VIAFLDASAVIYLIEGAEPFASRVRAELGRAAQQHRSLGLAVSRLSWLECRVGPARARDTAALAAYDAFFDRPDLGWIELSQTVVELATAIRVAHGLRTPDALQAASCLQLGAAHLFFTGDSGFTRVEGLDVHRLT
jgi:predicted nucleic acid-binding protein